MEYESMPLVCFDCGGSGTLAIHVRIDPDKEKQSMVKTKDNNDGWVAEGSRTLRVKFVGKGYLAWEKLSVVPQIRYKVIEKGVSMNKGLNKEMNVAVKLSTTKGDSSRKEKLEQFTSTTSKGIMGEVFRQRPTIGTSKMGENAV
ncbi:hypothetical protein GOBAR_DD00557 [Gossypium barbadense]|nr:hypothetical protein GOBAR_DD00557 [Gossypium barbadense]